MPKLKWVFSLILLPVWLFHGPAAAAITVQDSKWRQFCQKLMLPYQQSRFESDFNTLITKTEKVPWVLKNARWTISMPYHRLTSTRNYLKSLPEESMPRQWDIVTRLFASDKKNERILKSLILRQPELQVQEVGEEWPFRLRSPFTETNGKFITGFSLDLIMVPRLPASLKNIRPRLIHRPAPPLAFSFIEVRMSEEPAVPGGSGASRAYLTAPEARDLPSAEAPDIRYYLDRALEATKKHFYSNLIGYTTTRLERTQNDVKESFLLIRLTDSSHAPRENERLAETFYFYSVLYGLLDESVPQLFQLQVRD